jgi:glucose-6-phosphate isomerase
MPDPWISPVATPIDPVTGNIPAATRHYQKTFEQLEGRYADRDAYAAMLPAWRGKVVYEVWEHKASTMTGDLIFGTSVMQPGRVGDEYFLTSGHQHQLPDRAETYYCLSGTGVMLMESPDGEIEVREWTPGMAVYVPPYWIHRSVNTGAGVLVTLFNYSADSGQNYELIAEHGGMRQLVVADGAGWKLTDNPHYQR